MFLRLGVALLALAGVVGAQSASTPCCGVISPDGQKLLAYLDSLHVDKLWLPHQHVSWQTGERMLSIHTGHEPKTHCSAFAAAAAKRLNIYMMRPPDHSQIHLAAAQEKYFLSRQGRRDGWVEVHSADDAQARANRGEFVVLVYGMGASSGHIAIVRPSLKSQVQLDLEGPQTTQAGGHNFESGTAKFSFVFHEGAWPDRVKMFAHKVDYAKPQELPTQEPPGVAPDDDEDGGL